MVPPAATLLCNPQAGAGNDCVAPGYLNFIPNFTTWLLHDWWPPENMSLWLKGKKCTAKDNINIIMSWVGMNSLGKTCRASCPCKFLSYIWGIFSIVMFTSQHNKFQIFFLINSTKEINWGEHCFLLFLRQQCDDAKQCCGSCVCSLCHPSCVLPRPRRQAKRFLSRKG